MPTTAHGRRAEKKAPKGLPVQGMPLEQDEAPTAATRPDATELRRIRAAYFGRPLAERQKVVKPVLATKAESTASSKSHREQKRKCKHTSHSRSDKSASTSRRSPQDQGSYVYGHGPHQDPRRQHSKPSRHRQDGGQMRGYAPSQSSPPPQSDQVRSAAGQVATARTHPALQGSRTTSSRLAPVKEDKDGERYQAHAASRTKRHSTLLGSIFRRSSATNVPTQPKLVECLTCGSDDVPSAKSAKLHCGHRMCHECLKRVFNMSVTDPAHMPPKCCTDEHIPLKYVDKLFSGRFKRQWNERYQEYNTKNRIYCPSPKCGNWIKPSHLHTSMGRKYALCPKCKTKVCAHCNMKMHRSLDCPQDPDIQKLEQQAKDEGWQRCYNCSALVELKEGCNHMTCRCTAEFCIKCGSKWKSCDCPWFNYTQIPHPDRLDGLRVPEPIQVIYRRVFAAAGQGAGDDANAAQGEGQQRPRAGPAPEQTYQEEMDARREQERLDADLARRMQFANFVDDREGDAGEDFPTHAERMNRETWGVGNQAGHFLNENFVQNAADVVMSAFGDAKMGRRGERASGRRRSARESGNLTRDPGLVPNFLGDESVLGVGPSRRARGSN